MHTSSLRPLVQRFLRGSSLVMLGAGLLLQEPGRRQFAGRSRGAVHGPECGRDIRLCGERHHPPTYWGPA
jgi:hypothetical protein